MSHGDEHRAEAFSRYSYSYAKRCFVNLTKGETTMWTKPAATEMRFGFEVTMYVMNK